MAERPPSPSIEWESVTHRFAVGGHKGYVIAAHDEDGRPVHIEIRMAKEGGVLRGLLDCLAASVCLGLDRGVPLSAYTTTFAHVRFEPSGYTADGKYAHSIVDYVFRWLRERFPAAAPPESPAAAIEGETCSVCGTPATWQPGDACPECGQID